MHSALERIFKDQSKITTIAMVVLLFSTFFPVSKVLYDHNSWFLGEYFNYFNFVLYGFDICIIGITLFCTQTNFWRWMFLNKTTLGFLVFFLLQIIIHPHAVIFLELILVFRLVECIFLVNWIWYNRPNIQFKIVLQVFLGLLIFEMLLGLAQYISGHSVGFPYGIESHLSTNMYGVAKVVVHSTSYLRAYGTFSHPNILAFFFGVGLLVLLFLNSHRRIDEVNPAKKASKLQTASLVMTFIFLFSGLCLTASRVSLFSFLIVLPLATQRFHQKMRSVSAKHALFFTLSMLVGFYVVFKDLLHARLMFHDDSLQVRVRLFELTWLVIHDHFWFGVGLNQHLLSLISLRQVNILAWDIQPVHNIFVLVFSEIGLFGVLLLISSVFLYLQPRVLLHRLWQSIRILPVWCSLATFAVLVGSFDHFIYTNPQAMIITAFIFTSFYAYSKTIIDHKN